MTMIICPHCGALIGHVLDRDTKLVRGICPSCGAKFTAEGEFSTVEGWVKVGCWEPPKEVIKENG